MALKDWKFLGKKQGSLTWMHKDKNQRLMIVFRGLHHHSVRLIKQAGFNIDVSILKKFETRDQALRFVTRYTKKH